MRKISILVIVLAVLLILAVPAMAQPDCSVLTATASCNGVGLEWTAWDDAVGYLFCWQYDGNSGCSPTTGLITGGPLGPGTYMFHPASNHDHRVPWSRAAHPENQKKLNPFSRDAITPTALQ